MKNFFSVALLMLAFVSFGFTPNIDVSLHNETKPKIEQFQELSKIDFTIYEIQKTEFIYNLISSDVAAVCLDKSKIIFSEKFVLTEHFKETEFIYNPIFLQSKAKLNLTHNFLNHTILKENHCHSFKNTYRQKKPIFAEGLFEFNYEPKMFKWHPKHYL